jgi:hypothetical protein
MNSSPQARSATFNLIPDIGEGATSWGDDSRTKDTIRLARAFRDGSLQEDCLKRNAKCRSEGNKVYERHLQASAPVRTRRA